VRDPALPLFGSPRSGGPVERQPRSTRSQLGLWQVCHQEELDLCNRMPGAFRLSMGKVAWQTPPVRVMATVCHRISRGFIDSILLRQPTRVRAG
jgi:hypothetical protein